MRRVLAFLLVVAACGDGASSASTTAPPPATTTTIATIATTTVPATTTTRVPPEPLDLDAAPVELCESIVSHARVEAFLGQAAGFDNLEGLGYDPARGAVICAWVSIDSETDLPYETLAVSVYLGDPVPGSAHYTPDEFPEIRVVDDIGDEAFFASHVVRRSAAFREGEVVAIVDYWPNLVVGSEGLSTPDDLIELLREIHDRLL
jgi:hypothetical protein